MENIVHRFGPQKYDHQPGAINKLPIHLANYQIQTALVLHGKQSWQAVKPYWPEEELQNSYTKLPFAGECSQEEVDRVWNEILKCQYDAIIGVGGGKILDTVKAAADKANIPCILIPTLPSNCACFTPISIMYSQEGKHLGTIRHSKANNLVLVEPQLLAHAPIEHLSSGIGDTLAKWYESTVRFNKLKPDDISIPLEMSHHAAKQCRDYIMKYGEAAYQAAESKTSNADFSRMVDTVFALSGLVGGLGGRFGQSVGAHAFNYGYVSLGKNEHLHGSVVAYGVLFQLSLEEKFAEIKQLLPLYKKLNLPVSWEELNISHEDGEIEKIAEVILSPTSRIFELPMELTKQLVIDSLLTLEAFITGEEVKSSAL